MTCASEVAPGVSPRPWLSVRRERGTPTPGNLAGVHKGGGPGRGPRGGTFLPRRPTQRRALARVTFIRKRPCSLKG